jgi:hypothetical protein
MHLHLTQHWGKRLHLCAWACGCSSRTDVSTVDATHCIMMKLLIQELGDTRDDTSRARAKIWDTLRKQHPLFDFVAESQLILNCPFDFFSRALRGHTPA